MRWRSSLILTLLLMTAAVQAERPRGPKVLSLEVTQKPAPKSGWDGLLEIAAAIEPQFHINSNIPSTEFLIPTSLKFRANPSLVMGPTEYPKGIEKRFSFSEEKLSVYEGRTVFKVPYKTTPNNHGGKVLVQGVLTYQACTQSACLPPRNDDFGITVQVGK